MPTSPPLGLLGCPAQQVGHPADTAILPTRPGKDRDDPSLSPQRAAELTSSAPLRPRSATERKNWRRQVRSSLVPTSTPTIARLPSPLTAVATTTLTSTNRPASLIFCFCVNASNHRNRYSPPAKGRSRKPSNISRARSLCVPPGSLRCHRIPTPLPSSSTHLVDTPSTWACWTTARRARRLRRYGPSRLGK